MERASGIIMPIYSLPSKYGIGTFGVEAYKFVDFLKEAEQKYWQILPLGPTNCGNSPYSSWSTFAGNPNFIDLDILIEEGLLNKSDLKDIDWGKGNVDYEKVLANKDKMLKIAYKNGYENAQKEVYMFIEENSSWIYDYALYTALKEFFNMKPWYEWPDDIKFRENSTVEKYKLKLKDEINYHIFVQYLFFRQWSELKGYANKNEIQFIGDLPIYVAMDSADVWTSPEFFQLDERNMPLEVAGVPPDYFCEDGQLWGNPLYNWGKMFEDGYGWWIRRIGGAKRMFDVIRIDHFRGLASYWSVPAGGNTAKNGEWKDGPGIEFINRIKGWFNGIEIIAEDLGILTEDVRKLLKQSGFPGMKVLEFAFDDSHNSDYLPHKYNKNCVCYCGTHDNATIKEWLEEGDKEEIKFAKEYFNIKNDKDFVYGIIRGGMASCADLFLTQMQDYLLLGKNARTNIPGKAEGNWVWRMNKNAINKDLAKKIAELTILYGRSKRRK